MTEFHRTNPGVWVFLSALLIIATLFVMSSHASDVAKENDRLYRGCMADAQSDYKLAWDAAVARNADGKTTLPTTQTEVLDRRHSDAKDTCLKLYK